jgi:hypothetical protein
MSFLTYPETRPWAAAIKKAVITEEDAAVVRGSELRALPQ